jgi:hypothetical protein
VPLRNATGPKGHHVPYSAYHQPQITDAQVGWNAPFMALNSSVGRGELALKDCAGDLRILAGLIGVPMRAAAPRFCEG